MKEGLIFSIGWVCAIWSIGAFELMSGNTVIIGGEAKKLIEECEVTLPQNKTCKLVAVPVEEDDK